MYANMKLERMKPAAARASNLMKALSSEKRLMLLCLLNDGEKSVGALADQSGLLLPAVSQQLALLRKDNLVDTRRDGQSIYYTLKGDEARRVIGVLYDLYCADEGA